jgi:hypothetical protein
MYLLKDLDAGAVFQHLVPPYHPAVHGNDTAIGGGDVQMLLQIHDSGVLVELDDKPLMDVVVTEALW